MELVEAEQLPGASQLSLGIVIVGPRGSPGGQELGIVQQELVLPIGTFDAGLACIGAAVVLQVELPVPERQTLAGAGLEVLEELAGAAQPHARRARMVGQPPTVLQHFAGRAATAVSPAVGREQLRVRLFLLVVAPRANDQPGRQVAVVGMVPALSHVWRDDEMGKDLGAVQPLPPEAVVRQAVVLIPTQLRSHEVLQAGLHDQLGECPGEAERVGQPENGRFGLAEAFAEVVAPQQELPDQGFSTGQVTVGLDPHAAGHFPAILCDTLPDLIEEVGVILGDVAVELGLTLGEVEAGELLHQAQDATEGSGCLASDLADGPQPGHVQVGVADGDDVHAQGRSGRGQALTEGLLGRQDAVVEAIFEGLSQVQLAKCVVQGVQQARSGGVVRIQFLEIAKCYPSCGHKIAGGLVYLCDCRLAHQDRLAPNAKPTVQGQIVGGAIAPAKGQRYLLVIGVDALIGVAVYVGQRLRMDELTRITDGQDECHRRLPVGRHREGGAQDEILAQFAPASARFDH